MIMADPAPSTPPRGEALRKMIYVITCGMCGQTWQRATAHDGQVVGCIFCGCQGQLRLGVAPSDSAARGPSRVEAWLYAAGVEER